MTEYLLNKARKEGKIEGRIEGIRENKQDTIVEILQERFGSTDKDIRMQIKKIQDEQTLEELFRSSLRAESLDGFKQTLSQRSGISQRIRLPEMGSLSKKLISQAAQALCRPLKEFKAERDSPPFALNSIC